MGGGRDEQRGKGGRGKVEETKGKTDKRRN